MPVPSSAARRIGIIGLGAMGSAMAVRLLASGYTVTATDLRKACITEFESHGGRGAASAKAVADASDVVLVSVNTESAFHGTTTGVEGIAAAANSDLVVVDTCTLAIADKTRAADALAQKGVPLLDCTLSGNRNHLLDRTLSLYASGDEAAFRYAEPVLETFTGSRNFLGRFGNASRLKFILNHLILIHNAATAEALSVARKAGLDLEQVHRLVGESFASSGVWRERGRMMVAGDYVTSRGTYGVARKDSRMIAEFARENLVPTPMFQAALQLHMAGMAQGYSENDAASVFEVYAGMAGTQARPPQTPVVDG